MYVDKMHGYSANEWMDEQRPNGESSQQMEIMYKERERYEYAV